MNFSRSRAKGQAQAYLGLSGFNPGAIADAGLASNFIRDMSDINSKYDSEAIQIGRDAGVAYQGRLASGNSAYQSGTNMGNYFNMGAQALGGITAIGSDKKWWGE